MAKAFAKNFYNSTAWKKCRTEYAKKMGYLCEECFKNGKLVPGEIVHHKIKLTPFNINNPSITLSFKNLELLCRECHAIKHSIKKKRYCFKKNGEILF